METQALAHFHLGELERNVRAIRDAFVHRPVPEGLPHGTSVDELKAFMLDIVDTVSAAVSTMLDAVNVVFSESAAVEIAPDSECEDATERLRLAVDELIAAFHEVWRRPWASQYAGGQPLLSAMAERPLRDLLGAFEEALDALRTQIGEDPEDRETPWRMNVVFEIEEEAEAFNRWASEVDHRLVLRALAESRRKASPSWGTVALAFLLGHWWGKDS